MKYLAHFKSICENIDIDSLESETIEYENELSTALHHIEKNGMYVDNFDLGSKQLVNEQNLYLLSIIYKHLRADLVIDLEM